MQKLPWVEMLHQRGFFYQCTNEKGLSELLSQPTQHPIYSGFDCTASTLHVGNLVQLMILRWVQHYGYKPIILLGGATTKIGDPSGKDETRILQTEATIDQNRKGIEAVIRQFIRCDGSAEGGVIVDNNEWFEGVKYIDFLREVGRHFSVNRMLTFDSVKARLDREQNLSFLEFNYLLFQAYDFTELYRRYGCRIQCGGSDQWGNIVSGVELARRQAITQELFGITTPLITTASGAKMGKTAKGAVWLTADQLSAYDYWQFWRNTEDKDVTRFLKLFTELPLPEIEKLALLEGTEINEAKIILANEATAICHGREAAHAAYETAKQTFTQGGYGEDLPVLELGASALSEGIVLYKLYMQMGLAESGGAARRLIAGGGAKVNDEKCMDADMIVTSKHLDDKGMIKLSAGKKKHGIVKVKA